MIAALLAGLLAGYGVAMPIGAVGTYLVSLTARTSLRIGACAALGVASADGLYALVAAIGGSALAHTIEPVVVPLRWASGIVLLAIAARGAITAVRAHRRRHAAGEPTDRDPVGGVRAYLTLLGITVLNPVTVVYFAALIIGGRAAAAPDLLDQGVFVAAAFAASASWQLLIAGGGAVIGRAATSTTGRLATALGSSVLIAVLAVRLLA